MKVDNVAIQYEIPGFDIAPQQLESGEEEDFGEAPYSLDPGITAPPPAGGWQQLLGLTQLSPTPTSIDPPTRQVTGMWRHGATASFQVVKDAAARRESALVNVSPEVGQMMKLLASREETIAKIRQRAGEAG
jgi:hypothetical protein